MKMRTSLSKRKVRKKWKGKKMSKRCILTKTRVIERTSKREKMSKSRVRLTTMTTTVRTNRTL